MEKTSFKDIDSIIAKVLAKEASVNEIIIFSEWINESEENRREADILSEYWEGQAESDNLYAEISFNKNKSRFFDEDSSRPSESNPKKHMRNLLLSIAASLLLIVLAGAYWFMNNASPTENYILLAQNGIETFTLPDSSKVVLNKNSRLIYTNKFLTDNRTVMLEGEGYFEVTKKADKKFTVQVCNSQIEVLGTKFNVNARHADEYIVTTLVEGSVLFKNGKQQQLMKPNQQLTCYTRSGLIENVRTDAHLNTEWKDNIFRYNSIRMQELMKQLGDHYGTEIVIDERYRNIKVSGAFQREQSLEKILTIMQNSINFKWKMSDNKIVIY